MAIRILIIFLLFSWRPGVTRADDSVRDQEFFEKKIAPLLIKRCIECHSPNEKSGGLDLTSKQGWLAGGDSDEPLWLQDLEDNLLLEKIESGEMPPPEKGHSRELSAAEKKALSDFIRSGSHWPDQRKLDLYEFTNEVRGGRDWWSFQSIERPRVPVFPGMRNPIDAFIYRKLKAQGLDFSPAAVKFRLFRRVHYDMTGLPPRYEDSQQFASNPEEDAYEKLVDRLLASPRFGERVGRNWLDLIRYADTNGYERDAEKMNGWKYRDWVIESLNADKPYDLFAQQQLAGDQMVPVAADNVVGTTMLRVGTWDDEPNDKLEYKYDRLEDLIHVTSTAFMGLTVKCARCHDHKFDPIPQADYYRFGSVFWPGDLIGNKSAKVKGYDVFGWTDQKTQLDPIRLLKKGDPRKPQQELDPGFLSLFPELDSKFAPPGHPDEGTARRLEFAKRLVSSDNPLFARVVVNRIWQHYFSYGLVRTSNNFGYKGDLPTHPELLDWLASELIEQQWHLKPIHRLILTSRTYRQSSSSNLQYAKFHQLDPLNRFLWRMPRKRLAAEAIRDSILAHSGRLNLEMSGRGFTPDVSEEALEGLSRQSSAWQPSTPDQQSRRTIYLFVKRSMIPPLLASFDFADTTRPCGKRDLTIVAPQALALLNNDFVHRQSEVFAAKILQRSRDRREQIQALWRSVYSRDPSRDELVAALSHFDQQKDHFEQQENLFLSSSQSGQSNSTTDPAAIPSRLLALHLEANVNVETDSADRVRRWKDRRGHRAVATASKKIAPKLIRGHVDGKSVVQFNGRDQYLELDQQILTNTEFTVVLVGHDENRSGNREFFSNWNSNGNSTSSVFLGLTDGRFVRFSDQFRSKSPMPSQPFVLTALSRGGRSEIFSGRQSIGSRKHGLTGRNLTTKYVLGTQGNFGHEFQNGWLAELLVYDRALSTEELEWVWSWLEKKYPSVKTRYSASRPAVARTPELLALASLCHVLLNSNEAIFID